MTTIRPTLALVWALATLTGCGAASGPASRPAADTSRGVTLVEESDFYPDGRRTIDAGDRLPRVDYKSGVRIEVDPGKLAGGARDVLPPLTAAERDRIEQLREIIAKARVYVREAEAFRAAFAARIGQPGAGPELAKLINQQARSGLEALRPLDAYLDAADPARRQRVVGEILPPGGLLNIDALARVIAEESAEIVRRSGRDAAAARGETALLKVRASVLNPGRPSTPLHVDGYDNVVDDVIVQEDRITTRLSESDRDRLGLQFAFNQDLALLIGDLRRSGSEPRDGLGRVADALRGDLSGWRDAVGNLESLLEKLDPVLTALDPAGAAAAVPDAQKQIVARLKARLERVKGEITRIRGALQTSLQTPATGPAAFDAVVGVADRATAALGEAVMQLGKTPAAVAEELEGALADLEQLRTALAGLNPGNAQVDALAATIAPSAVRELRTFLDASLKRYPALAAGLSSLVARARAGAAVDKLAPIESDQSLLEVPAKDAGDGFLLLKDRVPHDRTVKVEAALVERVPDARGGTTTRVTNVARHDLQVEKFGLVNTWSANLIFVNQLGDDDEDDGRDGGNFVAAPSISWTLHYNPPPAVDGRRPDAADRLLSQVKPGVGVNVAALNFDGNGVEVGIGGHVSLFKDLLMVGAGYNLNADNDHTYVFIGVSLFEAFSQLGLPSAGR